MEAPTICKPHPHPVSNLERENISIEIEKLLKKRVIVPTTVESSDFFSNIFTRPKKDGSFRMILNLKKLNSAVNSPHFKMESIKNVINMVHQDAWMASVDLKDAFSSVPIHPNDQKFLKFFWETPYKFVAMPNGYSDAMRIFTKILKPPFAQLRKMGHLSVIYVDDSYLQGETLLQCQNNVSETVVLLQSLGFTVHPEKSVLEPKQKIVFLGFIIDSKNMTIRLTLAKKEKIRNLCKNALTKEKLPIREVAKVLGNMVASFEAVPFGPLHYRILECEKIKALKIAHGNFDSNMKASREAQDEIMWWYHNIDSAYKSLKPNPVRYTVYSDASRLGWGATDGNQCTNGHWLDKELEQHINVLELKAAYFVKINLIYMYVL